MKALADLLTKQLEHSPTDLEPLLAHWNHRFEIKRKENLIAPGKTEAYLYFVLSGTMRIFYQNDADEICVGFAYKDNLICAYPSFISNKASKYYIQAITKTKLVAISRSDFYKVIEANVTLERLWRKITEQALLGKIERETEMLTFSPEERYLRLLDRSPHLFQIIPQKYIASYLRMKPETLSRIKKG